jgi:uncharacterized Zn finger protein
MEPSIQEEQIRARATPQSYSRGESYYKRGAIFDTVRRSNEIEARCAGSSDEPYYVNATLDDDGNIEYATCSCEYDYEGDCKHIVALLLTYLHEPESFEIFATVQDTLEERSKEELIALIRQMTGRYPDLRTLIDRPVPRPQTKGKAVDVLPFRRELRQALGHFNQWGDRTAQFTVQSIADTARAFANAGQWHNASAIYRVILEESTGQNDYPADDEGDLIWALNSVVDAVVECLEQAEISADERERGALIECLADAYIWNIELGGYGLGDGTLPDALLQQLQPHDIPKIRNRVQAALARRQNLEFGEWGSEALTRFDIELDALDSTDPEETLQRLRAQGMHRLEFEKLLAMGRDDEAIQVVVQHLTNPYERLVALPYLVDAGHSDVAIRLANESLRAGFDHRLAYWLDQHYQTSADHHAQFELRLLCMQQQPSVDYYAKLKQAADAVERWAVVRPDILQELEQKKEYGVLTQVYLYDEEWDAAWETAERIQTQPLGWRWVGPPGIDLTVAETSKHARPQKAIPVFVRHARQQINGRTRGHYGRAAGYLATVRDLYQIINDEQSWNELIRNIREEFRRLPALQDELTQAGL